MYDSLSYPLAAPEPGTWVDVAPGVRWIRLPLPYRLDHINVWALDDSDDTGEGWSLVDTGTRTEATVAAWESLRRMAPLDKPLKRVFVTHMHPDHIGMAGWLTRSNGAPLWISPLEYLSCRALVSDSNREAPAEALRFYREAGWEPAAIETYRARFGAFGKHVYALPDSYRRMSDGDVVRIGGNEWQVVVGHGHSPEHCSLYCASLKIFISGDQVLPRISSNVSVYPLEPEADPMAEWFDSLERIEALVPDETLVLPSHHDCFFGLHARIRMLRKGEEEALEQLRELLREPRRVVDTFPALFRKPISQSDAHQLSLATGEAIANLNYLRGLGEVRREVKDGVAWYSRA